MDIFFTYKKMKQNIVDSVIYYFCHNFYWYCYSYYYYIFIILR